MHFTEPVYRNPYWPTWPLLQITQGCSHNRCKFCTMYKGVRFAPMSLDDIEADLEEIAATTPYPKTLQVMSANPLVLNYGQLEPIFKLISKYLPGVAILTATRVSDLNRKTVDELRSLREMGLAELSLGVESGDDWTLERIGKGYRSSDILEQCNKLEEAGIPYWVTFLNGVAGRSHSKEHAVHTAEVFNQLHPMVVGTGGLTLFPGTPLLEETKRGEFDPLGEIELMEELRLFLEVLDVDAKLITHHTSTLYLTGPFLNNKQRILDTLQDEIENADEDMLAMRRAAKRTL